MITQFTLRNNVNYCLRQRKDLFDNFEWVSESMNYEISEDIIEVLLRREYLDLSRVGSKTHFDVIGDISRRVPTAQFMSLFDAVVEGISYFEQKYTKIGVSLQSYNLLSSEIASRLLDLDVIVFSLPAFDLIKFDPRVSAPEHSEYCKTEY